MHAVVFHGPGQKHWEEVPDPKIVDDSDAIVRITSTTICGTDLHILKGDVPAMTPGRILGHEAVATVTETGPGYERSSRVITCCCRASRPAAAAVSAGSAGTGFCIGGGGWIFGHKIDAVQAEFARVPSPTPPPTRSLRGSPTSRCSTSLTSSPPAMRSACSTARSNPAMSWPSSAPGRSGWPRSWGRGCTHRPRSWRSTHTCPARLGQEVRHNVVTTPEQARAEIDRLTDSLGADVAVEAVGIPETFEQCTELIRPGGQRRGARQAGDAAP